MKRQSAGGVFPSHMDTPPIDNQSSDSSDDQEDAPGPAGLKMTTPTSKMEKACDAGTPSSWGKRKIWRRKRWQGQGGNSNPKDDQKAKESVFLDKIQTGDCLARRQSLPPLSNFAPFTTHHDLDHNNPSTATLLDEAAALDVGSRDSTPRPQYTPTSIAPNDSFPPEVSELIESVRHPYRHRRNDSNGSARMHKRQGSNGSAASGRGLSLEATPLRSYSTFDPSSTELSVSRRGSNSTVPYSKMDTTDSGSNSEQPENLPADGVEVPFQKLVPRVKPGDGAPSYLSVGHVTGDHLVARDIYSNESSVDTHGSDGEGNEADAESTSDGGENRLIQFSSTEPNETTESAASPESDELTSCSTPDTVESVSDVTSNLIPTTQSTLIFGQSHDLAHDTVPRHQTPDHSIMATPNHPSTASYDVAMLVSQPELEADTSSETRQSGLTIPVHIRRQQILEQKDDGKFS